MEIYKRIQNYQTNSVAFLNALENDNKLRV